MIYGIFLLFKTFFEPFLRSNLFADLIFRLTLAAGSLEQQPWKWQDCPRRRLWRGTEWSCEKSQIKN
jgi:hypothetical protein